MPLRTRSASDPRDGARFPRSRRMSARVSYAPTLPFPRGEGKSSLEKAQQPLALVAVEPGRVAGLRVFVSSARPYIGDQSKRSMPADSASSTIGVRSSVLSKVCQVPIPITGTCSVVRPSLRRSSGLLEVVDRHRFDRVGQCEAEDLGVEIQLAFERALDVLRDSEAVLLPLEGDVGDRQPFLPERRHDQLGLVRRDDLVLQALKEDDGGFDPIEVVNRGPLSIDVAVLGPAAT